MNTVPTPNSPTPSDATPTPVPPVSDAGDPNAVDAPPQATGPAGPAGPVFRGGLKVADAYEFYDSPLSGRYASEPMKRLFSPRMRHTTWRRLWAVIARAQHEMGLPISSEQVADLDANLGISAQQFELAARFEREVRHDVMAHVMAYGAVARKAAGVIHLGCTSCDITDNADLIIYREALGLVHARLLVVLRHLRAFAEQWADFPTLGYTHYQPAQLTTVGKRAALWMHDFLSDGSTIEFLVRDQLPLRGLKGATGTQASFLMLFSGDVGKVAELEARVAQAFGFRQVVGICGQTYSRKTDARIVEALAGIACSAAKFANDLRLLAHDRELEEPFGKHQIGSSAMPHKRNPMRAERVNSLARSLANLVPNTYDTAQTQWLERTLDDSANRRLTMSEAFLLADAILLLLAEMTKGLVVNEAVIRARVEAEMPFLGNEPILMAAVHAGGDRQELHERLRQLSHAAAAEIKAGRPNPLARMLREDAVFGQLDLDGLLDPSHPMHVGRAGQQVREFLTHGVDPFLRRFENITAPDASTAV